MPTIETDRLLLRPFTTADGRWRLYAFAARSPRIAILVQKESGVGLIRVRCAFATMVLLRIAVKKAARRPVRASMIWRWDISGGVPAGAPADVHLRAVRPDGGRNPLQ